MSDSHGDAPATARAVSLLSAQGAARLFHCGDICGEQVLDEMAGHDCTFVWGNCDAPSALTRGYVATLGLPWPRHPVRVEIDKKRIAVYHGHERGFKKALKEPRLDYIFHGHSHERADRRENGRRIINPGALHRARVRTVATLDLATDELRFLCIDTGQEVKP